MSIEPGRKNYNLRDLAAVLPRVDHIVYGTPDLESTVDELEKRLGVRASPGGQHPGQGTRNALISLGPLTYLEILAPDPGQPAPNRPRWMGIDELEAPQLVTWAAKGSDLNSLRRQAEEKGVRLGEILAGSRARPNGSTLTWELTNPRCVNADGIVPFFIDWGNSQHPAVSAPRGPELVGLTAEHPKPRVVAAALKALKLALAVCPGAVPVLVAILRTPDGMVELR